MRTAEDRPIDRDDRHRRLPARRLGALVRIGNPRVADRRVESARANGPFTRTIDDSGTRPSERVGSGSRAEVGRVALAGFRRDQEAAPAGAGFANDLEPGGRVLRALDDDVLQQIAEVGLDRALVAGFDLEIVGNRALLVDLAVGLRQNGARRVADTTRARPRAPRATSGAPRGRRAPVPGRAPTARATRARCARSPARTRAPAARCASPRCASCARRRPSAAAARSAAARSDSIRTSSASTLSLLERLGDAVARRRRRARARGGAPSPS